MYESYTLQLYASIYADGLFPSFHLPFQLHSINYILILFTVYMFFHQKEHSLQWFKTFNILKTMYVYWEINFYLYHQEGPLKIQSQVVLTAPQNETQCHLLQLCNHSAPLVEFRQATLYRCFHRV